MAEKNTLWLVVGLGNPGPDYANHRHNVGFMAIDRLAGAARFSKKFHGDAAQGSIGAQKVIFLKPHTYMNHSGRAVQAAAAFYKIPPEQILVLHDELDLPVGKLRIKQGGGANGQNGVRDVDACLGQNYWRVRIGIGHPGDKARVHDHVLSSFAKDELPLLEKLLDMLTTHAAQFFDHSPAALMSKVSDAMAPPREKKEKPAMDKLPASD